MPFNGSGTFSLVAGNPVVTGTVISSTVHNNTNTDIATGLTNCVTRDGQSAALANIPMGGYKHTGAAAGSATGEYLTYGQTSANFSSLTVGTFTVTGNFSVGGNLTLGDAPTDTLTINPNAVVWNAGSVTHSGNHTISGNASIGGTLGVTGVATFSANPAGRVLGGTYTPTLTAVANIFSSSPGQAQYIRVGNVVTVSGTVNIRPSVAGSTVTQFGISLPIASNFSDISNCAGVANLVNASGTVSQTITRVTADTTNDRADFVFYAPNTNANDHAFTFTYVVI